MRRLFTVGALLVALASSGVAGAQVAPTLRVLDTSPVTVRGSGFHPREHVTVILVVNRSTRSRSATASAAGRFVASFADAAIGDCRGYVVRATGDGGSRATFKFIPECAQP
jgi:hypothetical protein